MLPFRRIKKPKLFYMTKYLLVLSAMLVLFSCAPRPYSSYYHEEVKTPYRDLLVIFVEDIQPGFYGLTEEFYDAHLRHQFNSLHHEPFRESLRNAMRNEFNKTHVHYDHVFQVQQDYAYQDFMQVLRDKEISGVLLVSSSLDRSNIQQTQTFDGSSVSRLYQSYLLDVERNKPIWSQSGEVQAQGRHFDHRFAQTLASISARELRKHKLIYAKPFNF